MPGLAGIYAAAEEDNTVRCENCNAENGEGAEYCGVCGERLIYGEVFFKRENNVDSLPRLSANVKPIRAFRGGRPPLMFFRKLFKKADEWVVPDTKNQKNARTSKKSEYAKQIAALLIVAVLLLSMLIARLLR
jgi:hypothetical protein